MVPVLLLCLFNVRQSHTGQRPPQAVQMRLILTMLLTALTKMAKVWDPVVMVSERAPCCYS